MRRGVGCFHVVARGMISLGSAQLRQTACGAPPVTAGEKTYGLFCYEFVTLAQVYVLLQVDGLLNSHFEYVHLYL